MKKIFTFFAAMTAVVALNAQTVDYAIDGFVDEEQQQITELNLGMNDDLNPAFVLTNNGPDVPANTDSIMFDITIEGQLLGSSYIMGSQLQTFTAGASAAISGQEPLLTAQEMTDYGIEGTFNFCYEVRIVGAATDPDASNNQACITITRGTVGVNDVVAGEVNIYPNPANDVINVENAENAQISVFDINGRMITTIESASANQTIDASNFAKGMYIVRIANGNNVITKKVSVVR